MTKQFWFLDFGRKQKPGRIMSQSCYGKEFGQKKECSGCEFNKHCKESVYPYERHKIIKEKRYVDLSVFDRQDKHIDSFLKIESNRLSGFFSELLFYLQNDVESVYKIFYFTEKLKEILQSNPKTFQITLLKIINPHKSFSELAEDIGCDKQLIAYHLDKSRHIFPEIDKAFIIDKRKYPKSMLRKRKVLSLRSFLEVV